MWKEADRQRRAEIEKKTKGYPSDLTDAEWRAIAPVRPRVARTGRQRRVDVREILNAIRDMARSGGGGCGRTSRPGRRSMGGSVASSAAFHSRPFMTSR
jgi:hypothetical protein